MSRDYYISWTAQVGADTFPVASAEDCFFVLNDGRQVLDFISTSFQTNFGHHNKTIVNHIKTQLDAMPIASPRAEFELKEEVSSRLKVLLKFSKGKIFYTVSGAEAVENAIKIAREIKERQIILAREKSYHGATLGALSVTGDWRNKVHATIDEWTQRIPEPEADPFCEQTREIIEQVGADKIAAFCLETITGANGVIIAPDSWWQGIQALCKEYDIFLILDEVLCGFGRTGTSFAFQHYGITPDMVCMAKGITGGYVPFGALWTSEEISEYYDENVLSCGLTNYAHPLGLAALSGVLDILEDKTFFEGVGRREIIFSSHLRSLQEKSLAGEIRQKGFLAAIEFPENVTIEWSAFFDEGVHLLSRPKYLVIAPPLITSGHHLEQGFAKIEKVIEEHL